MRALTIKLFCLFLRVIYYFLKMMKVRKKITFISRQGNEPSIDIKLLQSELKQLLPDYQIVIKCRILGKGIIAPFAFLPSILAQMYHIATSKMIILDSYCIPISILKHREGLLVLQMWHALGLMKKAGYASIDSEEGRSGEIAELLHMHQGYTHILASSSQCEAAMMEVFGYQKACVSHKGSTFKRTIICALPRVDYLQDMTKRNEVVSRIYATYPSLRNRSVILYAPTSRKDNSGLLKKIEELGNAVDQANQKGSNYTLIIKLHPFQIFLQDMQRAAHNENTLFDSSFSTTEIGMMADACVSDYSSLIYEFLIMKKPTYFFAFDLDEYKGNRGLFLDYEKEIPGEVFHDAERLLSAVTRNECLFEEQQKFLKKYVSPNDNSNSKALAQDIMLILNDD